MAKTYWVMKTPGSTEEWIEMNGRQFYEFIKSSAGKDRYFMDCDTYKIEVSHEQYKRWKTEANHHSYLQEFEDEILILSLDNLYSDIGIPIDELLADLSVNVEEEVINRIGMRSLFEAVRSLPDGERWLITELYLREKPKTEQEIAESSGVSQPAIHKQKNKILQKLKIVVIKS